VVGAEGLGRGAAGHRLHHRGFHLHVAAVVEKFADQPDDLHPLLEHLARLGIDDQIEIALAVTGLDIGQAVELLRQRPQRLGDHLQGGGLQRQLAGLGLEQPSLDADNVAHIPFFKEIVDLLAQQVAAGIDLEAFAGVLEVKEGRLAELAHRHHPAGHPVAVARVVVTFGCEVFALGQDVDDGIRGLEGIAEQLDAGLGQGFGLFPPLFEKVARCFHDLCARRVVVCANPAGGG